MFHFHNEKFFGMKHRYNLLVFLLVSEKSENRNSACIKAFRVKFGALHRNQSEKRPPGRWQRLPICSTVTNIPTRHGAAASPQVPLFSCGLFRSSLSRLCRSLNCPAPPHGVFCFPEDCISAMEASAFSTTRGGLSFSCASPEKSAGKSAEKSATAKTPFPHEYQSVAREVGKSATSFFRPPFHACRLLPVVRNFRTVDRPEKNVAKNVGNCTRKPGHGRQVKSPEVSPRPPGVLCGSAIFTEGDASAPPFFCGKSPIIRFCRTKSIRPVCFIVRKRKGRHIDGPLRHNPAQVCFTMEKSATKSAAPFFCVNGVDHGVDFDHLQRDPRGGIDRRPFFLWLHPATPLATFTRARVLVQTLRASVFFRHFLRLLPTSFFCVNPVNLGVNLPTPSPFCSACGR